MIIDKNMTEGFGEIPAILGALPHPVLIADANFRVCFVNRSAADALGYQEHELQGTTIQQIVSGQYGAFVQQVLRQVQSDTDAAPEGRPFAVALRHKSGAEISAVVFVTSFERNGERYLLCTCLERHDAVEPGPSERVHQPWLDHSQGIVPIGSWRWDVETDQVVWSSDLCRIFGISPDDFQMTYADYLSHLHPDDRGYVQTTLEHAIARGLSFDIEHRIIRPDGEIRHIHGQGAADVDEQGRLRALLGVARDITDRKAYEQQQFRLALEQTARQEAERASERFQFLARVSEALGSTLETSEMLDQLMDLLIPRIADWCTVHTLSENGMVTRLASVHRDPKQQKLLESLRAYGYFPHPDGSHPLTQVVRDAEPVLWEEVTDELMVQASRSAGHLEGIRALKPTSAMCAPMIARGRAFGVMVYGLSDDVRRFTQRDLELATEITHRAAVAIDNAELYREAQNAARAREEFVSMVSHELKTPLTAIKGYMQVLGRHLDKQEWERDRILGTRERLDTQVERLELLVSDILDASRIQLGRLGLNFQPDTDLVELARQVASRFDEAVERSPDHMIQLDTDGPVRGRWDVMRLDQVLSNLLSNALKYSPDGGDVHLKIRQEGNHALITVTDEGIGISREERQRLFTPFHRGSATVRGISGTGLGLYITKQIVEEHQGSITIDSEPGSHTSVRVALPLDPLAAASERTDLPPESPGDGHVQFE